MRELSTLTFLAIDDPGIISVPWHEGDSRSCLNCLFPLGSWPIGEHPAIICHIGLAQDLELRDQEFRMQLESIAT